MTDRPNGDALGRDRWLRRLRRLGVVVPVAGALAATGLAGILARHDSAEAAPETSRSASGTTATPSVTPSTPTPTPSATKSTPRRTHVSKHTTRARKPTLTSAATHAPVTHSGGS